MRNVYYCTVSTVMFFFSEPLIICGTYYYAFLLFSLSFCELLN